MKDPLLRALFTFNGIFVFAGSLLGPLYAVYVLKLGNGVVSVSTSSAIFMAATTLFTFIVSKLKDGDKTEEDMLRAGFLLRAFVWFAYTQIHSIPQLITLQVINGLGAGFGSPAFDTLFAGHLDKNNHLKEYAGYQVMTNLVTAMGTFLGGILVARFGFTVLFYLMCGFALISFFGFCFPPKAKTTII